MTIPNTQAYLYNAPSGVEGDITRVDESSVEPIMLGSSHGVLKFGSPLKLDGSGNAVLMGSGSAATAFVGILAREVPTIAGSTDANNTAAPNDESVQGMLVRGYMSVKCTVGTPVRGGTVYVRITAAVGKLVGDFEADADGGNSVALTAAQATWASNGKDANNNAEIRVAR